MSWLYLQLGHSSARECQMYATGVSLVQVLCNLFIVLLLEVQLPDLPGLKGGSHRS